MSKVIHLKLLGGEEILGTLVEDANADFLILSKIRSIMAQSLGNGQVGLGMVPYMMGDPDGTIKIRRKHIVGDPIDAPPKNLEDSYLQQVSGITFATQGNGQIQV